MIITEDDYLAHYGILRKSGRYPWGSGTTQSVRNADFLSTIKDLERQGLSAAEIAEHFRGPDDHKNMWTSTRVIALKSIAANEQKMDLIRRAEKMKTERGMSNVAIGKELGMNESSVRSLLAPGAKERAQVLTATADMLRKQIAEKGYIDIGSGVHLDLGLNEDKLKTAVAKLEEEGYKKHYVQVAQVGTGKMTSIKALGGPDSPYPRQADLVKSIADVQALDGGKKYQMVQPPISISSKRLAVRHKEDGGTDADGVMYIRPGKKDLDIGANQYAQVRVMVDGTHYIKGMAVKKDGLPEGIDIVFNTNKSNTGNKLDALKTVKGADEEYFGAMIRQITDPKTGKVTSAMNLVGKKEGSGVEGGWGEWSKSLSSQVLSKQAPDLAKQQLAITHDRSRKELDEIKALTNPTVKRKLLESYAETTDSKAVDLKAAELPGQSTHVLMPVNTMKKSEIYAPNFDNGTRVALIRYPHGGTFEIPELTVNNKHAPAKKLLGEAAKDAVGVHHSVAERLSGADFDGDTVLVIPNYHPKSGKQILETTPALKGLEGFDSKQYKIPEETIKKDASGRVTDKRIMTDANTQMEMGKITNLISDMTIKGAGPEDLAHAVRHSMVVIDAAKHGLDYRASFRDNKVAALKKNYQGVSEKGNLKGAATLITRAKSTYYVEDRREARVSEGGRIDPKTGELRYVPTGKTKFNGDPVKVKSTKLAETTDARTLLSENGGTKPEKVYADHSNRMKALANEARLETLKINELPKQKAATVAYKPEVDSLNSKLNVALANSPRERQAQAIANAILRLKKQENPEMTRDEEKKERTRALVRARIQAGAEKEKVDITPREWEAIQAGAISPSKLRKVLANTDLDKVKAYATPRPSRLMDAGATSRAKTMLAGGATQAEVARALGVSLSTLKKSLG